MLHPYFSSDKWGRPLFFLFLRAESELGRRSLLGMPVVPSIFGEDQRSSGAIAAPTCLPLASIVPVVRRTRAAALLVRTFPQASVSWDGILGLFPQQSASLRWFFPNSCVLVRPCCGWAPPKSLQALSAHSTPDSPSQPIRPTRPNPGLHTTYGAGLDLFGPLGWLVRTRRRGCEQRRCEKQKIPLRRSFAGFKMKRRSE